MRLRLQLMSIRCAIEDAFFIARNILERSRELGSS
jgi:hypothetical protein